MVKVRGGEWKAESDRCVQGENGAAPREVPTIRRSVEIFFADESSALHNA